LPLVTNGGACRRIPKSTQVRASRRNARKADSSLADQTALWPKGTIGDGFVAMNLEIPNENPNVDLDRNPGSHRAHGGARRAGAGTIPRSAETVVRHEFRRRDELRLHQGLGMREVDERGRLVCSQSAQQQKQQTLNPAPPAFPMP
jgi:hypothetical protein